MSEDTGFTRRQLLASTAVAGGGAALLAGIGTVAGTGALTSPEETFPSDSTIPAQGHHQAGMDRPARPQLHALFIVFTLEGKADLGWLSDLGMRIHLLTAAPPDDVLPDGAGRLTVTVGLGPRVVAAIDGALPGAASLPAFQGDEELDPHLREGDVLLQICADDPTVVANAAEDVARLIPGTIAWRQRGFRPRGEGTVVRSPLGFHDGIQVPHGSEEVRKNVLISAGPAANGAIAVIRVFRLDTTRFNAQSVADQERVIGRAKNSGAPLSGKTQSDDVDLGAKTETGEYVIPASAHVRRAHPAFVDAPLMLRRSYAYDNGGPSDAPDSGLIFVSFQSELRTFVATQRRLDELDSLMDFATPRASFTFLVLPGFDGRRPLGSNLIAS